MDIYLHSPIRLHRLSRDNLQFILRMGKCVFCAPITLVLFCNSNYHPSGLLTILTLIYVMSGVILKHTNPPDCYQLHLIEQVNVFNVHVLVRRKNILIYISNKMQRYTVYFIWKLLYMFRVVPPPIIRSENNCICSIWYLSHRYCYLPLAAGSSNGVTNTRCCRYSCLPS
jgi:hypothetical protein